MSVRVGFLGMTHLGLCSAAAAAAKGFETVAFDPDPARIARLQAGELPIVEPDLDALLAEHGHRLSFTCKPVDLASCDLVYIAPDVATDDEGRGDLSDVEALLAIAESCLGDRTVRVVLSQVQPGFMRPRTSRGPLYYQVETLIFGRAVERALYPERFIVGCRDPQQPLPEALQAFLGAFGCPLLPMRFESAELAKISINAFLVASVTTTNVLAEICEQVGADWSEIAPALRLDARIGPKAYLAPGLGLAGGNLERDLAAIRGMASRHGTDDAPVRAYVSNSRYRRDWMLRSVHEHLLRGRSDAPVALLGLAYKIDTASTKNSPALALVRSLPGMRFHAYDPVVRKVDAPNVSVKSSAQEAIRGCAGLVIATPWSAFASLDPARVRAELAGDVVIDPYAVLASDGCSRAGLRQFVLGRPRPDAARR